MTQTVTDHDIIVIGGGIVGLAISEKLISEGRKVLLLEKKEIAAGASAGNAGGFAFSDIMPLASPAILPKALKWFMDPVGPFRVVPQDLPKTLPWLTRFLWATRQSQFNKSLTIQANIMHLGRETLPQILKRTHLEHLLYSGGALHLFQNKSAFEEDIRNWEYRASHGLPFETCEGTALSEMQPGLDPSFIAGIFAPQWQSISDPKQYCLALHDWNCQNGMSYSIDDITHIEISADNRPQITGQSGKSYRAQKIIIAAGAWSNHLSRQLGDPVPLIAERGYNTTLPKSAFDLHRTLVFSEHGFVVSPLADHIRVGGASEIADINRPANFKRSQTMLAKAARFLPELKTEGGAQWMGPRPSIPDTLPVISPASRHGDILYAFGHGHLGLTQSSATAQLIADLVQHRPTSIDITPLRVSRF